MLPSNVLRPSAADYTPSWADRPRPSQYDGRTLEVGALLQTTCLGVSVTVLEPGQLPCPLHAHWGEEELFMTLEGELTVRELAPDDDAYTEYTLAPRELVAYPPGTWLAHQSRNHGDAPVRYLALSSAHAPGEFAVYPDSGKTLIRGVGIGVLDAEVGPHVSAANAASANRPSRLLAGSDRPAHCADTSRVPERDLGNGVFGRPLARAVGATQVFANLDRLTAGSRSSPLHWHTRDEELVLVLAGTPTLRQVHEGRETRFRLEPGDWVVWHPGDRIAHQLIADDGEASVLVVGTDAPDDVTVFPESDTLFVRALNRRTTLRLAPYFAGED